METQNCNMDNEIKDNLIILLKLFKDKPQYLIKFFLEHNSFTEEFLTKVFNSIELNRIRTDNYSENDKCLNDIFSEIPHFKSIKSMNDYFNAIILNEKKNLKKENIYEKLNKDLEKSLYDQLEESIKNENFEEASIIRDRMIELNIKFKK